jgi:pseudouridine-5'-phosphate glycosidase
MLKAKWEMGLNGSVLIANPIPAAYEVPAEKMETFIQQALNEANSMGISGKAVTPFLLKRIAEVTGGESLEANIALIKHNAGLAARIAVGM